MPNIKSVLFVCTGNSCRSVMAEGLLKKRLKELGKPDIEVRSAGIVAMDGLPPTLETIGVMKKEGIDLVGFRTKRLTEDLIKSSDLIIVMEYMHKDEVVRMVPEAAPKTFLMKDYGVDPKERYDTGISILDPIGRPMKDYEYTFGVIKNEIERIAKIL